MNETSWTTLNQRWKKFLRFIKLEINIFWIVIKRINKYLLSFVILNILWIYFYRISWINKPAKHEFFVVTGEIYLVLALAIVAGYFIYLITSEVPLIKNRIAFNGHLITSIGNIEQNIGIFTREFDLIFDTNKLDNCIKEFKEIDLNKKYLERNPPLCETQTFQEYLRHLYEMTKKINENGREEIEKLYPFSYLLVPSFFTMANQFYFTDAFDSISMNDTFYYQMSMFGAKPFDIDNKSIKFQLEICLHSNIKLYEYLKKEFEKYSI